VAPIPAGWQQQPGRRQSLVSTFISSCHARLGSCGLYHDCLHPNTMVTGGTAVINSRRRLACCIVSITDVPPLHGTNSVARLMHGRTAQLIMWAAMQYERRCRGHMSLLPHSLLGS
jgi:hypothetical protein